MKNNDGVIKTDRFTLMPSLIAEVKSFLNTHLGNSLIEIINMEHYQVDCKVKTAEGERMVLISLPARYFDNKQEN